MITKIKTKLITLKTVIKDNINVVYSKIKENMPKPDKLMHFFVGFCVMFFMLLLQTPSFIIISTVFMVAILKEVVDSTSGEGELDIKDVLYTMLPLLILLFV